MKRFQLMTLSYLYVRVWHTTSQVIDWGYGGGYYDKALSSSGAKKIGIAFELQKLSFDSEPHDIPMDYICNENGLFAF